MQKHVSRRSSLARACRKAVGRSCANSTFNGLLCVCRLADTWAFQRDTLDLKGDQTNQIGV